MAIRTSEQLQAMFQASRERKEQERLKHNEAQKRYRDKHKEQERLYFAHYREKNKEKLIAYQAEYRKKNREKNILYQQIYRQTHKEIRVIDEETNTVKRVSETIELPPVKSKRQVKELYQKWLDNLKTRETYLTGIRLYFNQLMQKSLEEELYKIKK